VKATETENSIREGDEKIKRCETRIDLLQNILLREGGLKVIRELFLSDREMETAEINRKNLLIGLVQDIYVCEGQILTRQGVLFNRGISLSLYQKLARRLNLAGEFEIAARDEGKFFKKKGLAEKRGDLLAGCKGVLRKLNLIASYKEVLGFEGERDARVLELNNKVMRIKALLILERTGRVLELKKRKGVLAQYMLVCGSVSEYKAKAERLAGEIAALKVKLPPLCQVCGKPLEK
jgi:hypothetical protein